MAVVLQKDGRIRVDDPHDALLLSLAGVELRDEDYAKWVFHSEEVDEFTFINGWLRFPATHPHGQPRQILELPLHVPFDVAQEIARVNSRSGKAVWGDFWVNEDRNPEDCVYPFFRRYNNRWNLMPDIMKEEENAH